MKPGDRKQRWKSTHDITAIIFLISAAVIFVFADGSAAIPLGVFCILMAFLEFRDGKRGWRIVSGMSPTMKRYYENKGNDLTITEKKILESSTIMDEYCRKNKVYAFQYGAARKEAFKGRM
jgi:hypothetical protein